MREEFMMTRQGKQYVLFAGLLDEAHSRGLVGIDTELIQVPEESNGQVAVVKATVQIEDASGGSGDPSNLRTFSGIGDASPQNVSRNIVPHLIRMAETRAKARALRDAVNVGATALEELSDSDDGPASQNSQSSRNPQKPQNSQSTDSQKNGPGLREAREKRPAESREEQGTQGSQGAAQASSKSPAQNEEDGKPGPRPVEASEGQSRERGGGSRAPKSQIDFIKTLAEEWRGEKGVERLESRIGKPLSELTRDEAEQWIDRLTPKEEADGQ
jgi:hypothetical protein